MNSFTVLSLGALLIAGLPFTIQDCEEPAPPSCDDVELSIDMSRDTPYVYVINNNPTPIEFTMELNGTWCGTSSCPIVVMVEDSLQAGAAGEYIPPPGPYCDDVVCCETGWTGELSASFTLKGADCGLGESASRTTCDGSGE